MSATLTSPSPMSAPLTWLLASSSVATAPWPMSATFTSAFLMSWESSDSLITSELPIVFAA
jgi:hypothetical protein